MPVHLPLSEAMLPPLTGSVLAVAVLAVAVAVTLSALTMWIVVRRLMVICPQNRLVVLSGRPHRRADGTMVGYRVCRGPRALRFPFIERLDYLDATSLYVQLHIERVTLASGGPPVDAELAANVRVTSDPDKVYNAVERFLGMSTEQMALVARETLEGCIRVGLADLSREEALGDPEKLARLLAGQAEADLSKLGLELDMLHVVCIGAGQEPSGGLLDEAPPGLA